MLKTLMRNNYSMKRNQNHFWSKNGECVYLLMALIAASATVWWLYQKREQLGSMFSNNNDEPLNLKTFPNVNLKGDADIPSNPDEKRFVETLAKTSEFLSLAKKRELFRGTCNASDGF